MRRAHELCLLIPAIASGVPMALMGLGGLDPAGFLAICMATTFVFIVVATAASMFEKIFQNGMNLQSAYEHQINLRS